MKNRKVSTNARQAFQNFKEELAKDMEFNFKDRDDHITKIIEDDKTEKYNHLGRS